MIEKFAGYDKSLHLPLIETKGMKISRIFSLIIIISFTIASSISIFGQNEKSTKIDSLLVVLDRTETDSVRVLTAIAISSHFSLNQPVEAMFYSDKALEVANKTGNQRMISNASYNAGVICFNAGLLEQSVTHFYKYFEIAQENGKTDALTRALINISAVRLQMKQFEKAEETLLTGLDFFLKKQPGSQDSLSQIGLATIYNNLGIVAKEKGDFSKAEEYYQKGMKIANIMSGQYYLKANLLNNLGMVYSLNGNYPDAYESISTALKLRQDNNDKQGMAASYRNLAVYYEKTKDDKLAQDNYYKAIQLAKEMESKTLLEGIYDNVYLHYERLGYPDSALKYHILLKEQNDFLKLEETTKVLTRLELTMQFQQREKLQKAEQKRKEQRYFFVSLTLVLIAVIIGLLYFLSHARIRRMKLEQMNSVLANKNLQLSKNQLETELEIKNKELTTNVIHQIQKNEMVEGIVQKLLKHSPQFRKENQELIKSIIHDLEKTMEESVWNEFELRFQHVHNDFYNKLNELNQELSPNERRLCAFLRLNMTTKEIASITGQSPRSIEVARTRLRKKLNLTNSDQGLIEFLSQI